MSETKPLPPRLPPLIRLTALVVFLVACIAALHWAGRYEFLQIPWSDLDRWLRDAKPEDALAAVIRLVGLVLGYWMLATTLVYVAGCLAQAPRALRTGSWLMLPGARRIVDAVLALSVTTSTTAAAVPAATPATATAQGPEPDRTSVAALPPETTALQVAIYPQTTVLPEAPPTARTYRVQSGESLRDIAAKQLGDATRWPDIWHANNHRLKAAGLPPDARPEIGWDLVIPSRLTAAIQPQEQTGRPAPAQDPGTDAGRATEPPPGAARPAEQVTVQPGDNLWSISAEQLGRDPDPAETARHLQQTVDTNLPTLRSGDPDLIYPGEPITVPGLPTPPEPPRQQPQTPPSDQAEPESPPQPDTPTTTTTSPPPTTTEPVAPPTPAHPRPSPQPPTTTTPPTTAPSDDHADDGPARGIDEILFPATISAALAAVTLRVLARRRRARRRSARPGSTTEPRPAEDISTELALATASGDVLERAWRAAAALGNPLRSLPHPLIPVGLIVRPNGDTAVHLSEPATPTLPFVADRDPTVWVLPSDQTDLATAHDPTVPVLETIVAVGRTDDGSWVFLDLESLGAVWVDGDPTQATRLARSIAAELAFQPADHYIDLTVAGGLEPPNITEHQGVMVVDHLDETMVRQLQHNADETHAYLSAQGLTTTHAGRVQGLPRDGLVVTVVLTNQGTDPVLVDRLANAALPGGRGLAVLALDALKDPATQLILDHDGTLHLPHLGITATAAGLDTDELHQLDDLIQREPETVTSNPHRPTDQNPTPPPAQPSWDYQVRLFADHRVETADGTTVSFRYGDPGVPNKNTARGPELLSYLALRGCSESLC